MKHHSYIAIALFIYLTSLVAYAQDSSLVDSLKRILESDLSKKERVDVYNAIAYEYRNQDSVQTAYFANLAIKLSEEIDYPEGKSNAYYRVGWSTMVKGSYAESLELFNTSLEAAQEVCYGKGEAYAFNGLGVVFYYQGNFPDALEMWLKSLKTSKEIDDKNLTANAYNNIGRIYEEQGDYPFALEYHLKSLKIREEMGGKSGMADSYSNIGKIYNLQGELASALEQYLKSLQIREELGEMEKVATSFSKIGKIYADKGDYPSAREEYRKALQIQEELGEKYGIANSLNNIGATYREQEQYDEALRYKGMALELYQEIGAKASATFPLLGMGKIYLIQKRYDKAISYLEEATQTAQHLGENTIVRDGAEQLALVYELTGRYRKAYQNMQLFKTMADSLNNEKITEQVTSKAMQYEFDKKQEAVKALQARKDLEQEQQLKTQKYYTYASVGGVFALFAIALVVYRGQQKQKKANSLLEKQKEEIASQAEELRAYDQMVSHDLKGPISAISQFTKLLGASLDKDLSDQDKAIMQNIEKQCNKSTSLIHGILEYASADKPAAFEDEIDLNKIIDEVRGAFSSTIEEKKAIIENTDLPPIQKAIPIKVYQLFYNLVGNALKFQMPDKTPQVKIYGVDNRRIVVEDNGIGFNQSESDNIFKPLNRLSSQYEGHGIGLGTCKRIVDIHGWEIAAESEVGKGSRFIISY